MSTRPAFLHPPQPVQPPALAAPPHTGSRGRRVARWKQRVDRGPGSRVDSSPPGSRVPMSFGLPAPVFAGMDGRATAEAEVRRRRRDFAFRESHQSTSRGTPAATVARCSKPASPTSSTDPPAPGPAPPPPGRRAPPCRGARCVRTLRSGCCICPTMGIRKPWRRSHGVETSSRSSAGGPGWRHSVRRHPGPPGAITESPRPRSRRGRGDFRFTTWILDERRR
jgi:hypothetical protein